MFDEPVKQSPPSHATGDELAAEAVVGTGECCETEFAGEDQLDRALVLL